MEINRNKMWLSCAKLSRTSAILAQLGLATEMTTMAVYSREGFWNISTSLKGSLPSKDVICWESSSIPWMVFCYKGFSTATWNYFHMHQWIFKDVLYTLHELIFTFCLKIHAVFFISINIFQTSLKLMNQDFSLKIC